MVFKVNDRLPEDCALRRGTLIAGVQKPTRSDPMQPAVDQIERFHAVKLAQANGADDPNRPETEEDAIRAEAQRRLQVRRMVEKAASEK